MHARRDAAVPRPPGSGLLRVLRRHVDLQRVNSALCCTAAQAG